MEEETNKPVNRAIKKFTYTPEALDICKFDFTFDHLHFKLLCKQAFDMSITPEFLMAVILENYLITTGYLDPRAPSSEGIPIAVTIKDIREDKNFFDHEIMKQYKGPSNKKESEKDSGSKSALDDDDDLDFM